MYGFIGAIDTRSSRASLRYAHIHPSICTGACTSLYGPLCRVPLHVIAANSVSMTPKLRKDPCTWTTTTCSTCRLSHVTVHPYYKYVYVFPLVCPDYWSHLYASYNLFWFALREQSSDRVETVGYIVPVDVSERYLARDIYSRYSTSTAWMKSSLDISNEINRRDTLYQHSETSERTSPKWHVSVSEFTRSLFHRLEILRCQDSNCRLC